MIKKYSYFRITITDFRRDGVQVEFANMAELNFYDSLGVKVDTSTVSCSASSYHTPGAYTEYLFDNDVNTYWHSEWTESTLNYINWVQIQFQEQKEVKEIRITPIQLPLNDFVFAFKFEASNDGQKWDLLLEQTNIAWTSKAEKKFELITCSGVLYLIQSEDGTLYTISESGLVEVENVETIKSNVFEAYGSTIIPTSEILLTLINPKVLAWDDEKQTEFTATVTATPYPQTIYSPDYDMTDPTILGIETVIVEASDDVTFAVSFDTGETWKHYTGTEWATLSEEISGMSAETIMAVPTDKWAEVATTGTFKIRATMPSVESTLSRFVVDYLNA